MIRLQSSKDLGRIIRQDDATELGIPTWNLLREAIQAGRTDKALDLLDYAIIEQTPVLGTRAVPFIDGLLAYIANFGEAEVEKALRQSIYPMQKIWLSKTKKTNVEDSLYRLTELHRGINSSFTVTEDSDRYVMRCDPCGSGGKLKRSNPSVAVTKKAYPWSWSRAGVSYYCTHCCIMWEIIPGELIGYPLRCTSPGEKADPTCIIRIYKKPELIPEEYFTRIGMTKKVK